MKKLAARKTITLLTSIFIFIICIRYIFTTFQWTEIIQILKKANWIWLLGAGAMSIIFYWLLRTLRWFILLKNLNLHINFIQLYICGAVSMGFTIITPFQSGEMVKVELLKRSGQIERFSGYSSFFMERVVDLFVVISIAAISILTNFNLGVSRASIIFLWSVLVLLFFVGVFALNKINAKGRIGKFVHHIRLYTSNIGSLLLVVLLTFCAWAMVAIGWQVCLYSISIDLDFQKSMALMSIITIINILSFIPGAVGVSEVSIAEFLTHINLSVASAQAGALVLRFYAILAILMGAVHFLLWKILGNKRANLARIKSQQK